MATLCNTATLGDGHTMQHDHLCDTATLGDAATLCYTATLGNTATLCDAATLCNTATVAVFFFGARAPCESFACAVSGRATRRATTRRTRRASSRAMTRRTPPATCGEGGIRIL